MAQDGAGTLTVRVPFYGAGRPLVIAFASVLVVVLGIVLSRNFPGGLTTWRAIPIIVEIAYLWLVACFSYKTSILRRNRVFEQRVTFVPRLVGPTPGAQAICFGKALGAAGKGGATSTIYPVRVRLANSTAYDLVPDARSLNAAAALAKQCSDATQLPLERQLPNAISPGTVKLVLALLVMACLTGVYIAAESGVAV